ncbi:MAG: hypothetical protein JO266_08545 [Acidobacteria bacterium]|nr:hypothetical protein [Acidobacteriota bacterium]
MSISVVDADGKGHRSRVLIFVGHEFREVLPPTLFFFVGFNLILFTKRLILEDYLIQYAGFFIATTSALIVGKSVLVANMMPFLRRFDNSPLVYPVLFKTLVYTLVVFFARLIEALAHYLIHGGILGGGQFIEHLTGSFSWAHFTAVQLWIFVLFFIYVTASELNQLFGDGELFRIFFTRRSSALKSTRRARIRLLTRLGRLTEAYPIEVLADPLSPPHAYLIGILRHLARESPARCEPGSGTGVSTDGSGR